MIENIFRIVYSQNNQTFLVVFDTIGKTKSLNFTVKVTTKDDISFPFN